MFFPQVEDRVTHGYFRAVQLTDPPRIKTKPVFDLRSGLSPTYVSSGPGEPNCRLKSDAACKSSLISSADLPYDLGSTC